MKLHNKILFLGGIKASVLINFHPISSLLSLSKSFEMLTSLLTILVITIETKKTSKITRIKESIMANQCIFSSFSSFSV